MKDEEIEEENRILVTNRYHFKNIKFTSSLTRHTYTNEKACHLYLM